MAAMELYVSLPRNEVALARAAADAGADAIKVHMNVEHAASGTVFGSYEAEHERIREIMAAVDCRVGLMPGADPAALPTAEQLTSLAESGLDFVNIYSHHMPLWFLDLPLRRIVALSSFDGMVETPYYSTRFFFPRGSQDNRIHLCEASIFPHEQYGQPFTFADYRRLRVLQDFVDVPLVVPTQKHITPGDAVWLKRTGTAGLIIGAIVTGSTVDSVGRATAAYRTAIDGA
jgi:hypothetical protein